LVQGALDHSPVYRPRVEGVSPVRTATFNEENLAVTLQQQQLAMIDPEMAHVVVVQVYQFFEAVKTHGCPGPRTFP
jgi:hypothetical protein